MATTHNILHPHYGIQCISTQEYAKVFPYIRLTNVSSPPMPPRLPGMMLSNIPPTLTAYQNFSTSKQQRGDERTTTMENNFFQKSSDPTQKGEQLQQLQQKYDNLTWKTCVSLKEASKNKDVINNYNDVSFHYNPTLQSYDGINKTNIGFYHSTSGNNNAINNANADVGFHQHPILRSSYDGDGDTYCKNYGTSSTSTSFTYESSNQQESGRSEEDVSSFRYKNMGVRELNKVHKKVSSAIQYFMKKGEKQKSEDTLHSPPFNMYEPFSYPHLWRDRGAPIRSKLSITWFPDWIYLIYAVLLWMFITQGIHAIQPETYNTTHCTTSQYVRMWICFACVVVSTNIAAIYCEKGGRRKRQLPLMFMSTVLILLLIHPKPVLCHLSERYIILYEAGVRSLVALFLLFMLILLHVIKRKCAE